MSYYEPALWCRVEAGKPTKISWNHGVQWVRCSVLSLCSYLHSVVKYLHQHQVIEPCTRCILFRKSVTGFILCFKALKSSPSHYAQSSSHDWVYVQKLNIWLEQHAYTNMYLQNLSKDYSLLGLSIMILHLKRGLLDLPYYGLLGIKRGLLAMPIHLKRGLLGLSIIRLYLREACLICPLSDYI